MRAALRRHIAVLLDVDPRRRVGAGDAARRGERRPLAEDRDAFMALHAQRAQLYESVADAILPATTAASA